MNSFIYFDISSDDQLRTALEDGTTIITTSVARDYPDTWRGELYARLNTEQQLNGVSLREDNLTEEDVEELLNYEEA